MSADQRDLAILSRPPEEMLDSLRAALAEGRGWSLIRLGDGELRVLHEHGPMTHVENRVASEADMRWLREESIQALFDATWVGWHQDEWLTGHMERLGLLPAGWNNWLQPYRVQQNRYPTYQEAAEKWGQVPELVLRSQFGWCNFRLGMMRGFVEAVLREQELLLIGEPMLRWHQGYLLPLGLGMRAYCWPGETSISRAAECQAIMAEIERSPARVMLASMGVWALPLAAHAQRCGKVGLDMGHLPDHNSKSAAEAHWMYRLNTCCEDSLEGTAAHILHAGAPMFGA